VSRTFPSCTFLVDASFGEKVLVENTTLQQLFSKENHQGMKFKVFLVKTTTKHLQKKLQQQIIFSRTVLLQMQIKQLSGHRSTNIFISMCSYIYAD